MKETYKKILLLDLDCTIVDMLPPWLKKYGERTGDIVELENIKDYDLSKICKYPDTLNKILCEPGFFYDMQPFPHAVETIQKLLKKEDLDVVFVTQPPRKAEFAVRDKRRWIKKYFPDYGLHNIIFCHRKNLIMGDLLFDDKPEHLIEWKKNNPNGITATLHWEYNKNVEVNFRGSIEDGWLEFLSFVENYL